MPARDVRVPALDGYALAGTAHEPEGELRATVVLASATAVPRAFYTPFADHLASRGFATLTFDYRGIGGSRPKHLRGFQARMTDWGERDLAGAIEWAAARAPRAPLLVVGHSAGGQIVPLAPNRARVDGVLAVAAQSGYWRHWSGALRWRRFLDFHVLLPGAALAFGSVPRWLGMGEDLPGGVAREWTWWCRHPDYLLRDGGEARRAAFASFDRPVLAVSVDGDSYAPRASVDALAEMYAGARVERWHVTRAEAEPGHFGFFRPRFRESLWPRAVAWLEARAEAARVTP